MLSAGVMLSGCGLVTDHSEYELESPGDTAEIRHYKYICVNERNGAACYYVYDKGTYLPADIKNKYLKLGCRYGDERSCKAYNHSWPVLKNKCEQENNARSCGELGSYHNYPNRIDYLNKGCELNDGEACYDASTYYLDRRVDMVSHVDLTKSYYYAKKSCDLDYALGCNQIITIYYLQSEARSVLKRECSNKTSVDCDKYRKAYIVNDIDCVDCTSEINKYMKKSCDLGRCFY